LAEKEFEDFNFVKPLQKAVTREQYITPTPIQAAAIPRILQGRDILGVAQTGTGKTAAFALPILHNLAKNRRPNHAKSCRVLVLSPTRELASQIAERFSAYGRDLNLKQMTVYGGVSEKPQIKAMRTGVHVLVATPGRLLDLMNQGHIELGALDVFVLDEADRMLDMGFLPDIKKIIKKLPDKRQSLFFSATMPDKIVDLSNGLLYKPVKIDVTPDDSSTSVIDTIQQRVLFVEHSKKRQLLAHLLKQKAGGSVLVFSRTKHGADRLAKILKKQDFSADSIHGDRTQNARTRILKEFKSRKIGILVATDVAARGIDVDGISHVINFDLPNEPDSYVHRIGRTGRAGAKGIALSFCTEETLPLLRAIEKEIEQKIEADENHPWHVPGLADMKITTKPKSSNRGSHAGNQGFRGRHRSGGPPGGAQKKRGGRSRRRGS
jgi:ATP-dependent RNA helicase RhlE